MKKTKILTILGVMLAMGLTACGGGKGGESKAPESQPESQPAPSSQQGGEQSQGGQSQQSQGGEQSSQAPASSEAPAGLFENVPDPDGHHFGAEEDVAADADLGTVAMKKAVCADNDGVVKYAVNQSVVTFATGSSNKSGTPEGYVKLSNNGESLSFKVKMTKLFSGKLFLLGRMDGYSTSSNQSVGLYRQGSPNIQVEIGGKKADLSSKSQYKYSDTFGTEVVETGLSSPSDKLSHEGYVEVCNVVLEAGATEFIYTRKASQNMIVRDFVLVGKEFDGEWAEGVQVAAAEGSIAYTKYANNLDPDMIKVEWAATDGTLSAGASIKNGTPTGFIKLDKNTQSISYAFNFEGNYDGQIYQRGAMDGYPGNGGCTYFSQTKGAKYGNFEMKVNGSIVYYGDKRDVKYSDMLGTEVDDSIVDSTNANNKYSYAKDCLIGDAFLKEGANTASYERVDSYNLAISHFIFIGKKVAAAHVNPAVNAAFSGQDDDSHWQVAEGDSFKFNRGEHHLVADTDETDTTSTCTVAGQKHWKCEICGKKIVEELPLAEHTWVSDPDLAATDTESTCTTHGIAHMKCDVCGAKQEQELPLGAHSIQEGTAVVNSDGFNVTPLECGTCHKVGAKMAVDSFTGNTKTNSTYKHDNNTTVTYKIIVSKAGDYTLEIGAFVANNRTKDLSVAPYTVKVGVGDAAVDVPVSSGTYEQLGIGTSSAKLFVLCPTITLAEGENVIALSQGGGGYRLTFGGEVRVLEK